MNTDTMDDRFEEWRQMAGSGKYLKSDLMKFAYEQGQRDLLDAMGKPAAYVYRNDKTINVQLERHDTVDNFKRIALYALPEDAKK